VGYEWPATSASCTTRSSARPSVEGGLITGTISPSSTSVVAPQGPPHLSDVERRTIEQALHESDWNKARAARQLGITRTQLYCRLRKYGLEGLNIAKTGNENRAFAGDCRATGRFELASPARLSG